MRNGDLVAAAEANGLEALVTGDKSMSYQQNLAHRRISILTLGSRYMDLRSITPLVPKLLDTLADLPPGSFVTVGHERDRQ